MLTKNDIYLYEYNKSFNGIDPLINCVQLFHLF